MKLMYKYKFAVLFLEAALFWLSFNYRVEAQIFGSPNLVSPANGSANLTTSVALQWDSVSGSSSYSVQVAADSSFSKLVVNQSGLSSTSYLVSGLSSGTKYYWRAGASTLIVFSGWSSAWSFSTVAPPPPTLSAPTLISPTDGSTSQPTSLALSWNSITNATSYHLQVSTSTSFATLVYDNSALTQTSQQITSLTNSQTYYWRVAASNFTSTSSWSTIWSFATTAPPPPPLPATPTLISPADGSVNQPTTIVLSWNASTNADHYWVQIAADSMFSNPTIGDSSITATSYQANNLSTSTKYYWRVKGINSAGSSNWSSVWNYTTLDSQVLPPSQPVLASPSNGSTSLPTTLTLSWNSVSNADHYWIQVAADQTFLNMVYTNYTIVGTSQQISGLLNSTTYYWQVRAVNAGGQSPWSSQWSFTTSAASPSSLSAPNLISPVNGISNVPTTVKFNWDSVKSAANYHFQLSTSSTFSPLTSDNSNLTVPSEQMISLLNNQQYYWRVSAGNSNSSGPWSSVWSFTTAAPLPAPSLISPPNDSTTTPNNITFMWNQVPNADHYHIQISKTPNFDTLIVDDSTLTVSSKKIDSLSTNQIYYWRVMAKDSTNNGKWSNTNIVKTTAKPNSTLAAPNLISPPNGAANQATTLTLQWSSVSGASSYSVQVSTDASFNNLVVDQSGLSSTSYQVSGLSNNTVYYWHAGSSSLILFGGWSQVWSFTTEPKATTLSPPTLISPVNGSVNEPVSLQLEWAVVSGANSYNLQVGIDSSFNTIVFNKMGITSNFQQVDSLNHNKVYYWHVNASNTSSSSQFSSTWKFQTSVDSNLTVPQTPVLSSPANASADEPLYPILYWNSSTNASFYRLQVATDNSFNNLIFDDSAISATYYQVGPLNQSTKYFWHVLAKNNSGSSAWSSAWYFTTQQGTSNIPVLVSPNDGAKNQSLTVVCIWDTVPNTDAYNIQLSTSPNFDSLVIDDSAVNNSSVVIKNLYNSTTYFWHVRAKVNAVWHSFSSAWEFSTRITSPTFSNIDTTLTFPSYSDLSQFKSSDYKLVGIPGAGNFPLNTFLNGSPNVDWLAYWDNGAPDKYLVEYNNGGNFVFTTGVGFWIIKKGFLIIDTTTENAPLNSSGQVDVQLHAGWNIITDPFTYPISWDKVKSANSISEPIYSFNGNFQMSSTLSPYTGYYFFNDANHTTLEIPAQTVAPSLQKTSGVSSTQAAKIDWEINIKLASSGYSDSLAWLGVSSNTSGGYNLLDVHKPRNIGSFPTVYFSHPEWNKDYPIFASDIRPSFDSYCEWSFNVDSKPWHNASLSFDGIDKVPEQYEVFFQNPKTNRWINLRNGNTLKFIPTDPTTSFKILIGTSDAVNEKIKDNSVHNSEFQVGNNFPNPFNNSTEIPVYVPANSEIKIVVYNIIGKVVKTIVNGQASEGQHLYQWNGTDDNGNVASSGIYFYRIIAGSNFSQIRKMILLK